MKPNTYMLRQADYRVYESCTPRMHVVTALRRNSLRREVGMRRRQRALAPCAYSLGFRLKAGSLDGHDEKVPHNIDGDDGPEEDADESCFERDLK